MLISKIALTFAAMAGGALYDEPSSIGIQLVSHDRDDPTFAINVDQPRISADGNSVVYASGSTRLVPDALDGNPDRDVFVFDAACNTTQIVSNAWDGSPGNDSSGIGDDYRVSISADGRYVAFVSRATNLVKNGPPDDSATDVYLVDRTNNYDIDGGRVRRISVAPGNTEPNGRSFDPVVSADGRYVVFASHASNLVSPTDSDDDDHDGNNCDPGEDCDGNGATADIFRYTVDSPDGDIVLISRTNDGRPASNNSTMPTISEDGSRIVYRSDAVNLGHVEIPNFSHPHVYFWNSASTYLIDGRGRIAIKEDVAENGVPGYPAIAGDGSAAAFISGATVLQPGDSTVHAFMRRFATNKTLRVTVAGTSGPDPVITQTPSLSHNGTYVAFASQHVWPSIGPDSIYRRDMVNGGLMLVSRGANGQAENGQSNLPSISANGQRVAFRSTSTNLTTNQIGNINAAYLAHIGMSAQRPCTPWY
ncbi:hypothetical protein ACFJIW_11905 [Tahibacter sp. UC22_41]|uniref:hypothetical protein n=1 Tax=Tahibacter sp. UC22_41 TaxID=3350178 RepID=UPI0036DBB878